MVVFQTEKCPYCKTDLKIRVIKEGIEDEGYCDCGYTKKFIDIKADFLDFLIRIKAALELVEDTNISINDVLEEIDEKMAELEKGR